MAPAAAGAGSLLSGYGGPGQGNQAILGSALLNGRSDGGGSSQGGSTTGRTGGEGAAGSRPSGVPAGAAGGRHASRSAARGKQVPQAAKASGSASQPYARTSGSAASRAGVGGSQTLGLSGADLLYILLALAALSLTGVLTKRLARGPGLEGDAG